MKRESLLAGVATTLMLAILGGPPLYAQKAASIAPAESPRDGWETIDERLLFLMTRLASVEASLDAIEKTIRTASDDSIRVRFPAA